MLLDNILSLNDLLRVTIFSKNTLDQRFHSGDACLALGLTVPAQRNKFLLLDIVALILISRLSLGLRSNRTATTAVRTYWKEWLGLVQRTERDMKPGQVTPRGKQLFFAVSASDQNSPLVAVGTLAEVGENLVTDAPIVVDSMETILRLTRNGTRNAGITLPPTLTVQPDDPRHKEWRAEIAAYRERALAREQAKASRRQSREREPA
jgi:hypothetical protein